MPDDVLLGGFVAAAQARAAQASRPRTDMFTFVMHWGMVAALVVSLLTGLRIAADDIGSMIGVPEKIRGWLMAGLVINWHVWTSWALMFIGVAYALFLRRARLTARVAINAQTFERIRMAHKAGRLGTNRPAWFAINLIIHWVAFGLLILMAITGVMLYSGNTLGLPHRWLGMVHGVLAYSFVGYIVLHVVTHTKIGTIWKMLVWPRLAHGGAAALAMLGAGAAVAALYGVDRVQFRTLQLPEVAFSPVLDGVADEPVWGKAAHANIVTYRGANTEDGTVPVSVRAYTDGERVHFLFRWPDVQRSQKHTPLIKTAEGWKVLQSELDINDEDDFYEDKFAVLLTRMPELASGTVHMGQHVLPNQPAPATRGLHYTTDGSVADMWHWKSVRTNSMDTSGTGFMDDDMFGPPAEPKAGKRYTAGYQQDPQDTGGYSQNWKKHDESLPLGQTLVTPKVLPKAPALLERMGQVNLATDAQDEGVWYLLKDETVPYSPELDTYPVGTVLPSVIIDGPFVGDRGDVRAKGHWADGQWTLEVSRQLDTGSANDLPIRKGEPVYLWVSAFNHNQTRHSQHLHPVRLVLE